MLTSSELNRTFTGDFRTASTFFSIPRNSARRWTRVTSFAGATSSSAISRALAPRLLRLQDQGGEVAGPGVYSRGETRGSAPDDDQVVDHGRADKRTTPLKRSPGSPADGVVISFDNNIIIIIQHNS